MEQNGVKLKKVTFPDSEQYTYVNSVLALDSFTQNMHHHV